MISDRQKILVQQSWADLTPSADATARVFYAKLFELDPAVTPLFAADMAQQRTKLVATIGVAVDALDKPDLLRTPLAELGARHAGYGVRPEHYATVGAALLHALSTGLGARFTEETKEAWAVTYGVISKMMLDSGAARGEHNA